MKLCAVSLPRGVALVCASALVVWASALAVAACDSDGATPDCADAACGPIFDGGGRVDAEASGDASSAPDAAVDGG